MSPTVTGPPRELPAIPAAPQATGPTSDSARIGPLDRPASAGRRRLAVPRRVAFWLLAFVFAAAMLGTTLPTPLYVIYQARWHFSAAIVTVVFAIYAAVVGVGVAAGFIGSLPAVLALSVLIAALCAVALYRIARATTLGRTVSQ